MCWCWEGHKQIHIEQQRFQMYKRCIHFNTSHTAETAAPWLLSLCVSVCDRQREIEKENDIWLTSTDPDKTETRFLIISKMILHHLEIRKLNTQLFLLMSSPPETWTHTSECGHTHLEKHTRTHIYKLEHALTQTQIHFPQMDRCCTSRGTETQQLFPSQSDGLPLIVYEYFTLSQNGCIPDRLQQQPHRARWSDH